MIAYELRGIPDPSSISSPMLRSLAESVLSRTVDAFAVWVGESQVGFGIVYREQVESESLTLSLDERGVPMSYQVDWDDERYSEAIVDWLECREAGILDDMHL